MALTGRAALLALLGVLVVALAPSLATLVVVDAAVLLVVAVDALLAGAVRSLVLTRSGATRGRQGEPVEVVLTVANAGRRAVRGRLRDAWSPSAGSSPRIHPLDVPPGERRRLGTTLVPTRRGDRLPARVTVRSVGPLGVAGRQGRHEVPWAVRVLPPFASRRFLPSRLERLRQVEGLVAARGAGAGTEFDTLRDYVPGDDVRSIDWRASARSTAVAVRTYRPERDRRVVLLLDIGRTSAARIGDAPRLDHALDAALLLAALCQRAGDTVDLLAFDAELRANVPGARADVLPRLVEAMALLEPSLLEADVGSAVSSLLARGRRRSLLVLFTDLNAAAIEEGLLPVLGALTARHTVLVAAVADPDVDAMASRRGNVDAVYDAAAAARARTSRRRITTELRRWGVEVVEAAAPAFPPAVADAYLALKAAGRL